MTYTILKDYPAAQYFDDGNFVVEADMKFAVLFRGKKVPRDFTFGSAKAYAEQYGRCPKEAVARCIEHGWETYWANGCGAVLTSHKKEKEYIRQFNFGDVVEFDGHKFELAPDHNDNVKLIKVK